MRSILIKNDLKPYIARKKSFLSSKAKNRRLQWCKENINKDEAFWSNILWTDESRISLFVSNKPPLVRRPRSESLKDGHLIPTSKFPLSIMVWRGFSMTSVGPLKMIEGNFDTQKYINTLESHFQQYLDENPDLLLQEEKAPCHKSRTSEAFKI